MNDEESSNKNDWLCWKIDPRNHWNSIRRRERWTRMDLEWIYFYNPLHFPLINISPHSYVLHYLPPTQFASSSLLLPAVRRFLLIFPPRTPPSILFAYMCRRQWTTKKLFLIFAKRLCEIRNRSTSRQRIKSPCVLLCNPFPNSSASTFLL